jgi:hypothetical protein
MSKVYCASCCRWCKSAEVKYDGKYCCRECSEIKMIESRIEKESIMESSVEDLAKSLLNDDNGISEKSYKQLITVLELFEFDFEWLHHVNATDGRFYLSN